MKKQGGATGGDVGHELDAESSATHGLPSDGYPLEPSGMHKLNAWPIPASSHAMHRGRGGWFRLPVAGRYQLFTTYESLSVQYDELRVLAIQLEAALVLLKGHAQVGQNAGLGDSCGLSENLRGGQRVTAASMHSSRRSKASCPQRVACEGH